MNMTRSQTPRISREEVHIYYDLSHDVTSGSDITLCNKINQPLVVYRFSGKVMTSIIHCIKDG